TLWNPIKFLWNVSSHTSFRGILTRGRTSWKKIL
ncbi:Os02g0466050, partial [Oryza sativa Japonica Group]